MAGAGGYAWSTAHEGPVLPSGQGGGDTLTVRLIDTGSERHQHPSDRGKPAISGMATVGGMLTAGTSGIADAEGKTKAENGDAGFAYTYQWVRVDGDSEADIPTATSKTYTLAAADANKKVKVKVSFQDDAGNAEGPRASDAYPSTGAVLAAPSVSQVALTSNPGTDETYAIGDIVAATVTFSSEVDVVTTNGPVHLVLDIGSEQEEASCAAATNVTEVSCTYEVREGNADADGISYGENALTKSGGAVTVTGSSVGANLDHDAAGNQSAHKVDGVRPTLSSAETSTDGTEIVLTFDEALSETTAASTDFTVMVADSSRTVDSVAASGTQATLTLASAVAAGEAVTVAYEDPTQNDDANAVQDAFGNDAASFDAQTVTNNFVPQGTLVLNLDAIAEDDTVNIDEQAAEFMISGDTGLEAGVSVSVTIGTQSPLAATSAANGTWSVSVPANAAYITEPSVTVTASASKNGLTSPEAVTRKLTVDLTAPSVSYTTPIALQVGVDIELMTPSTAATDIASYRATGLPPGLSIDSKTGVIGGTPGAAATSTAIAAVTVTDTAGNPDDVAITFPEVAKGDQKLTDFSYDPRHGDGRQRRPDRQPPHWVPDHPVVRGHALQCVHGRLVHGYLDAPGGGQVRGNRHCHEHRRLQRGHRPPLHRHGAAGQPGDGLGGRSRRDRHRGNGGAVHRHPFRCGRERRGARLEHCRRHRDRGHGLHRRRLRHPDRGCGDDERDLHGDDPGGRPGRGERDLHGCPGRPGHRAAGGGEPWEGHRDRHHRGRRPDRGERGGGRRFCDRGHAGRVHRHPDRRHQHRGGRGQLHSGRHSGGGRPTTPRPPPPRR